MNVQTIADARLRVLNVVARWPGSVHDTLIFAHSQIRQQFEQGQFGSYILVADYRGDYRGYRNTGYMCTPYKANVALNAAQRHYQK